MSSWIFIPGINKKFLSKAESLNTSAVIFDLEDSVLPEDKEKAINLVNETLRTLNNSCKKYIRVNSLKTQYFLQDINHLDLVKIDGLMIPKVDSRDDMVIIDYLLSQLEDKNNITRNTVRVIPLIESGKGVHSSYEIAASAARVEALAFGSEDYKFELDIKENDSDAMKFARASLVTASNAMMIAKPIDGIFTDFQDEEGLKYSSRKSKNSGFQGRLVIHPKQLNIVNKEYRPTSEEIEEAKKIVKAYEESKHSGRGAISLDGKMIDPPVANRAQKLIDSL